LDNFINNIQISVVMNNPLAGGELGINLFPKSNIRLDIRMLGKRRVHIFIVAPGIGHLNRHQQKYY